MIRKLRWPILVALVALVAIFFLLYGQAPVLQPVTEPVNQPAVGGVYAEGLVGKMVRLNPILDYFNRVDREVNRLLFSGLIRFDDHGLPQADLADSWGISRDGTIYNFSIRSNAKWHDGQPVTSDDIIFTIDLMRQDNAPIPQDLRELWKKVDIRRLDDKTLQFLLPEPFAPFLDYLTFGVLPAHLVGDLSLDQIIDSPFNLQPVGSGPYKFKTLLVENGVVVGVELAANKNYYQQAAFIEEIVFRYYPDSQTALNAYIKGDIQGLGDVSVDILPRVLAEPGLNLNTGRLPQLSLVYFNLAQTTKPFFQDANVRKALLMGLNRQRMIDLALAGQGILADGPIFPGTWAYYDGIPRIDYDAVTAVEMIKTAGYTLPADGGVVRTNAEGAALSFEFLYQDDAVHKTLAESIQKDWTNLGVEVQLKALPLDQLLSALEGRTYEAALVDLDLVRSPDPDPYPFWHQAQAANGQNYSGWDDRQASEYLEQARITLDYTERSRLYRNFQVRFAQELPALPLFYPVYRYAVSKDVQGVRMGPLFDTSDRFNTLPGWFLVTKNSAGGLATTSTP